MFKTFIHRIIKSEIVAGLETIISQEGKYEFNISVLKRNKDSVLLEYCETAIGFEKLKIHLPFELPIHLVINGNEIIHKTFDSDEQPDDDSTLLQKVLPNANINDFYIQHQIKENKTFVSVVRKNVLDTLLSELKRHGWKVISCSIGTFFIQTIVPLIESQSSIPKLSTTSFAAAFQFFLPDIETTNTNIDSIKENGEEYKHKRIFRFAAKYLMVSFVGILILNYLLLIYYSNKKEHLIAAASNMSWTSQYEILQTELKEKEEFISATGLLEKSATSFYADQLSFDLPPSIGLVELVIYPVIKKAGDFDDEISFTSKTLNIKGVCNQTIELNKWITLIKMKGWVKKITLLNYIKKSMGDNGEFNIEITIK